MPNRTRSVTRGASVLTPPSPSPSPTITAKPVTGAGYGSAGFGGQAASPVKPVTEPHLVLKQAPVETAPATAVAVAESEPAVQGLPRGRMSLTLTIVGVVIFIGGVSGLFIYALSGM